jgi:hypothetical protein
VKTTELILTAGKGGGHVQHPHRDFQGAGEDQVYAQKK